MYEGDMEKKPKKKFTDVQRWKYQKKKKPLVFLQEDIEERELLDESLEKFLQKTRVEYRKGRLRTFKEWIKMVRELLDELD